MEEEIQAWMHGPVVPEVYSKYSGSSFEEIKAPNHDECVDIDSEHEEILEQVMDNYGIFEAKYLENLTHSEDPWRIARGNIPKEEKCTHVLLHIHKKKSLMSVLHHDIVTFKTNSPQISCRNDKELVICTANLKFNVNFYKKLELCN